MQRSKVDLPQPDAPIRQITSCSSTFKIDVAEHQILAVRLIDVLDPEQRARSYRPPTVRRCEVRRKR